VVRWMVAQWCLDGDEVLPLSIGGSPGRRRVW
jgi:hypothetical protein